MKKINLLLLCFVLLSDTLFAEASNFWEAGKVSFEIERKGLYMQTAVDNAGCSFDEQPYECWTNEGELLFFRMHFYYTPPEPERPICTWATGLPSGAFCPPASDYGEVYTDFSWTPTCGQAGTYIIRFHAGTECGSPLSTLPVTFNVYSVDSDLDGILDCDDNCPNDHNPHQEDSYPPQGNAIGDACDCEGNFDCDLDVDGLEVTEFLNHFGRGGYFIPCTNDIPCSGDFACDGDVDAVDVTTFLEDFGRGLYAPQPCPACEVGNWCAYE